MDVVGEIEQNGAAVTSPGIDHLSLLGGRLCLDFVNTVEPGRDEVRDDYLRSYADLVAWGRHAGALTEDEAEGLRREAARRPEAARATLQDAITFREALYRLFAAAMEGSPPAAADMAICNDALAAALARARLIPTTDGFTWSWDDDPHALERVLWPVARSAADLLTSGDLTRVRACAGQPCGWLFVDTTKNCSRRWCSMEGCGSRAKARRYYQRRRTGN